MSKLGTVEACQLEHHQRVGDLQQLWKTHSSLLSLALKRTLRGKTQRLL